MKNRRIAIVAILLVAVLCLGVAFAALTDDLSIGGSVNIAKDIANDDFDLDVHFDTATDKAPAADVPNSAKAGVSVDVAIEASNGDADDHLKITVPSGILNFTGEEVVVTAYIINESSEFDAQVKINSSEITDDGGLCDITCKFGTTDSTTIAKGASVPVTITIKLKETVTGDERFKLGEFTFAIAATAVEPTT